jgi:hypothetical protein
LPGSETPKDTAWLKPGLRKKGFPSVTKEGRHSVDGSVWERTIYLHSLVVAVGRPASRLDRPICGTFPFRSRALKIGQNFYRSQLKTLGAVIDTKVVRNMTLGLFEMSSEIARERSYSWMAPKPILVGVFGRPGGPSIELARIAKTLRDSFKQGRAWASEPLPAIAAPPPMEAPQIPASEGGTPKSDSEPVASKSNQPPIPPDEYDNDAGGPHSLDEVIFD